MPSTLDAAQELLATLGAGRVGVLKLAADYLPFSQLRTVTSAVGDERQRLGELHATLDRRIDVLRGRLGRPPVERTEDDRTPREAHTLPSEESRSIPPSAPASRVQRAMNRAELLGPKSEPAPGPVPVQRHPERRSLASARTLAPALEDEIGAVAPPVVAPPPAAEPPPVVEAPPPIAAQPPPAAPPVVEAPAPEPEVFDEPRLLATEELSAAPPEDEESPSEVLELSIGEEGELPEIVEDPVADPAGEIASEEPPTLMLEPASPALPPIDGADAPSLTALRAIAPAPPPVVVATPPVVPEPLPAVPEPLPVPVVAAPPPVAAPTPALTAPAPRGVAAVSASAGAAEEEDADEDSAQSGPASISMRAVAPAGVRASGASAADDDLAGGEDVDDEISMGVGIATAAGGIKLRPTGPVKRNSDPGEGPRLTDEDEPGEVTQTPVVASIRPAGDDSRIAQLMDDALVAAGKGDLHRSIQAFTDVLDMRHDRVDAYIGRGRCYLELGDYSSAMSDFQRAEDLQPDRPEAHVAMGDLYFARKEYRRAIEFYDQAVELDGSHAMARCRRGISHYYRKNYRQAFQDLQRAYSLDPEIPNIRKYVQMAVKKMERGD